MKRYISVEIARIIACIQVICVHVCLPMVDNGSFNFLRGIFAGICADGVAVFWLISGFFMFNNFGYYKTLKRTWKKIIIPLLIVDVLSLFLGDFIFRSVPLLDSIIHTPKEVFLYFYRILCGFTPESEFAHLWFLRVYVLLMLVSPLIYSFINYLKEDKKRIRLFMIISILLMLINDISCNQLFAFSTHSINGLVPAVIEMIWGYIIFNTDIKDELFSKKVIIPLGIFIMLNLLRPIIYYVGSLIGFDFSKIYYWYSSIGLICGICIILISRCIGIKIKDERIVNCFRYIASKTFTIYILHMFVYGLLVRVNITNLFNAGNNLINIFIVPIVIALIIIIIVCLILFIKDKILKLKKYSS